MKIIIPCICSITLRWRAVLPLIMARRRKISRKLRSTIIRTTVIFNIIWNVNSFVTYWPIGPAVVGKWPCTCRRIMTTFESVLITKNRSRTFTLSRKLRSTIIRTTVIFNIIWNVICFITYWPIGPTVIGKWTCTCRRVMTTFVSVIINNNRSRTFTLFWWTIRYICVRTFKDRSTS